MREVRFHRELYRGELVDQAIKIYERYATVERLEDGPYWVARVVAASEERERRVADELGNYALGLTIQQRKGE